MSANPLNILDVVQGHMCTGCGACAYARPGQLQMIDTAELARRPVVTGEGRSHDDLVDAVAVCPGIAWPAAPARPVAGHGDLYDEWGPILEIWEGNAVDAEIRFRGSSGGVVTALALYAIEQGRMAGALHVRAREEAPLLNETVLSRDRVSLLKGAGSRYSPASPCEELGQIEVADGPCVFIGKPCDVAAVTKVRAINPEIDRKLGLTIAIFCAGTPSLKGTIELAKQLGADDPTQIEEVRYRGHGWPGEITAKWRDEETGELKTGAVSYEEGWGNTLQKYRQWRCHVCADHTGESADVSVGDPWYRPVQAGEAGRSLVLVRTEQGRRMIRQAVEAGYLELERRESWVLPASQQHLLRTRGSIWGRVTVSWLAGVAAPTHLQMKLFAAWWQRLSWKERLQSLTGTLARVLRRKLYRPERATPASVVLREKGTSSKPLEPEHVVEV